VLWSTDSPGCYFLDALHHTTNVVRYPMRENQTGLPVKAVRIDSDHTAFVGGHYFENNTNSTKGKDYAVYPLSFSSKLCLGILNNSAFTQNILMYAIPFSVLDVKEIANMILDTQFQKIRKQVILSANICRLNRVRNRCLTQSGVLFDTQMPPQKNDGNFPQPYLSRSFSALVVAILQDS
jgi:hypothetical protein